MRGTKSGAFKRRLGYFANAGFPFKLDEIGDRTAREFTVVDPDAEFLLEGHLLAKATQSDAFAFSLQIEVVAGHNAIM